MKILQLCNRIPFPLNDGGNIGVHYYTEGYLNAAVDLSMLAMNTSRHWIDPDSLPPIYKKLTHFITVDVDNRIKPVAAFINLFQQTSYNINRFISSEFKSALIRLLKENNFDIVQLEGLYLAPYIDTIRTYSNAKIVIRQHNIEFRIWERLAQKAGNPLKKWYLNLLAGRLKAFELKHINSYDLVLTISKEDDRFFKSLGPGSKTFLHPFGIDITGIPYNPPPQPPHTLYHIGAMDWLPNQESVDWLTEKVMPLVIQAHPEIQLHLAGRNMPERYFGLESKNIIVHGEVPDAQAFERDKSILVVPLLSGGGVRIKIFQAMAMGKTIVTTSIGVEGNEARDGTEVFIADTPENFADKINNILNNPELIEQTGKAARLLIEQQYAREKLIQALIQRFHEMLNNTP